MRLQHRIAIVVGGASGIGRGIAIGLAREGADVVVADLNLDGAGATAREIEAVGVKVAAVQADVTNAREVEDLLDAAERLGKPTLLVNSAGIGGRETFLETPEDTWDHVLAVDLKGIFLCSQRFARRLVAAGRIGKIVNVASTAAVRYNWPLGPHYHAAKAGVVQLTRVMANELAPHHINVNAIGPGFTLTELTGPRYHADPEFKQFHDSRVPWGRIASIEDMVGPVVFLCSADADYVTGQTIYVDGGLLTK